MEREIIKEYIMSFRIKYRSNGQPNQLESIRRFTHATNGARYKVLLNTETKSFSIVDDVVDVVVKDGVANDHQKLLIAVKTALVQLGVELPKEERVKRASA
jgi:hypothetical protein